MFSVGVFTDTRIKSDLLIIAYGTINIMTTKAVFLASSRPNVIGAR